MKLELRSYNNELCLDINSDSDVDMDQVDKIGEMLRKLGIKFGATGDSKGYRNITIWLTES